MDPEYVTEKLSKEEVRALRIRMVAVWCIGVGVAVLCGYMLFGTFGGGLPLILFAAVNLKTLWLVRDLVRGEKEVVTETIADLVRSTHYKPGPNSIVQKGYYSNKDYFYIRTVHHWLPVDKALFDAARTGAPLHIHKGKRSKVILDLRL